jgi:hypothetical protein
MNNKKIIVIGSDIKFTGVDTFMWDENFCLNFPNIAEYDLIILNFSFLEVDIQTIRVKDLESKFNDRILNALRKTRKTQIIVLGFENYNNNQLNPFWFGIFNPPPSILQIRQEKNKKNEFKIQDNFKDFISEFYDCINIEIDMSHASSHGFIILVQNEYQKALALQKNYLTGEMYFFPTITNQNKINDAIKWFLKNLGDWSEQFEYLNWNEYKAEKVILIEEEKKELVKRHVQEVQDIEERINKANEETKYIVNLLSSKEDELHQSCELALQELFEKVGSKLKILNVDKVDEFRQNDKRRKHDLQINLNKGQNEFSPVLYILINVKSSENKFKTTAITQMQKHVVNYCRLKKCHQEEIHSMAILNNQPEINPEARSELFGDNTKEAKEMIENLEYTIFSSYTLFRLYKQVISEPDKYKEDDMLRFLLKTGLLEIKDFEVTPSPIGSGVPIS